ncbi:hypothetical protein ScPMuIL_017868 [Solemya velum]
MATPSIAQHDDGDSEGDNDSILRSNRKKRTRKCLSSSDESEHSYNGFYKPSTPENKCYEYEKNQRSSERIREKKCKVFEMPTKQDVFDQIPNTSSPNKSFDRLKPRKLINNLMKVTNRYNHSPVPSDDSSLDFIDDSLDEEDDSLSSCSSIDEAKGLEENFFLKSRQSQQKSKSLLLSSDEEECCNSNRYSSKRKIISSESSSDDSGLAFPSKCSKLFKSAKTGTAKVLCSSSDSDVTDEEICKTDKSQTKHIKDGEECIEEYSSEENDLIIDTGNERQHREL